jgi:hypothetical protein
MIRTVAETPHDVARRIKRTLGVKQGLAKPFPGDGGNITGTATR